MKMSNNGINIIKQSEGLVLHPYLDSVKVPTIGFGSTMYENGTKVTMKDIPITEARAITLLQNTLTKYEKGVIDNVTVLLNQNQFDALVDFAYNLGVGALKNSTLLKKVNAKDFIGASEEFLKWNKAGGKILEGLSKRRLLEKNLFLTK